jgi:hypothetical protein
MVPNESSARSAVRARVDALARRKSLRTSAPAKSTSKPPRIWPALEGLENRLVPALVVPALNSLPGAHASIYLNFTGDGSYLPFDTNGDPTTFSASELNDIKAIWQQVAENFAPFNINVTTVDPRTVAGYTGGVCQVDLTSSSGSAAGLAGIGTFSGSSASNPAGALVFGPQAAGLTRYYAEVATHEAGHTLGLQHHSDFSGTTLVNEYSSGPGDGTAPFMGNVGGSARGLWWYGLDDQDQYENDLDIIAGAANGFGYRPDDAGNTVATATPLSIAGGVINNPGLISTMSDLDYWSFTTAGGAANFVVGAPSYGTLDPKFEVVDQAGNVVVDWQDTHSGVDSWSGTLAAGSYDLVVASDGISSGATPTNYGFNVGTYTISGSVAVSGAPTVATAASASPNPVTGTTTNLSVLGADSAGEANLTYTWSWYGPPANAFGPAVVSFSANGTNAAKNTTVTFYRPGTYTFVATISDGSGLATSSIVGVTVNSTITSIQVAPVTASVGQGQTQQFFAFGRDQFGTNYDHLPGVTWSLDSGSVGTISSSGLYTAPVSGGGSATVRGSIGAVSGTASVTVASTDNLTVATPQALSLNENGTGTGNVLTGAVDSQGNTITATAGTFATANGSVTINTNGSYTYTPNTGYFGNDSFAFTAQTAITSAGGTVNVTVNQVDDLTVVTPQSLTVNENSSGSGNVLTGTADSEGAAITAVAGTIATANGSVTINANGSYTYTPQSGYVGNDSFAFTAQTADDRTSGTVNVTVNPVVAYTLSASPSTVRPGGTITVRWTAPAEHATNDWIGLFAAGSPNTSYLAYQWVASGTSGSVTFTAPATPGSYEFRYLPNNGYSSVDTSNPVQVTAAYTLSASPSTVAANGTITVNWTAPPEHATNDWIGMFAVGSPNTSYLAYRWVASGTSGSVTFTAPATPGSYEFRYLPNNGYSSVDTSNAVQVQAVVTSSATFLKNDTTTQGNWTSAYGADGYDVSQDPNVNIPGYAQVSFSNQSDYTWASSTSDGRALEKPENLSDRIAGTWYTNGVSSFTIDVNLTDGNTHQVALYALDWDSSSRAETIKVLDAGTGTVLDTQTLAAGSFHNGEYLVWNIKGHVEFEIDYNGGYNAVISGLFFGAGSATARTPVNLAGAFNRTGIVTDGSTFGGGFDSDGWALSANLLGSSVTWNNNSFNLGAPNTNDVISAVGQTINLPAGNFSTLNFLAAGVNGNQPNLTFTVTYTDGTTQTFTQSISDWYTPQGYSGESQAVTMGYRNVNNGGKDGRTFYVYGYSFALDSSKTVRSITLPSDGNVEILAITLGN